MTIGIANREVDFLVWDRDEQVHYDILIASCGYEERARYLAMRYCDRTNKIVAFDFHDGHVLSYDDNRTYFESVGTIAALVDTDSVTDILLSISAERNRPLNVAVDISSMDRERLGLVIRSLVSESPSALRIDFLYASGVYDSSDTWSDGPITVNRPVSGFEGWADDPDVSVACLIGLGFEYQLALAALETLEPSRTICLRATSRDERFGNRVLTDNQFLLRNNDLTLYEYDLEHPLSTLRQLSELVGSLRESFRVALVPIGPKIFALVSMLLSLSMNQELTIWRVSSGSGREPNDRRASGEVIGLQVRVSPSP